MRRTKLGGEFLRPRTPATPTLNTPKITTMRAPTTRHILRIPCLRGYCTLWSTERNRAAADAIFASIDVVA